MSILRVQPSRDKWFPSVLNLQLKNYKQSVWFFPLSDFSTTSSDTNPTQNIAIILSKTCLSFKETYDQREGSFQNNIINVAMLTVVW